MRPLRTNMAPSCKGDLLKKTLRIKYDEILASTTTPVRKEKEYNDNETAARYNAAVVPKLRALGVQINDLYTPLSRDIPESSL